MPSDSVSATSLHGAICGLQDSLSCVDRFKSEMQVSSGKLSVSRLQKERREDFRGAVHQLETRMDAVVELMRDLASKGNLGQSELGKTEEAQKELTKGRELLAELKKQSIVEEYAEKLSVWQRFKKFFGWGDSWGAVYAERPQWAAGKDPKETVEKVGKEILVTAAQRSGAATIEEGGSIRWIGERAGEVLSVAGEKFVSVMSAFMGALGSLLGRSSEVRAKVESHVVEERKDPIFQDSWYVTRDKKNYVFHGAKGEKTAFEIDDHDRLLCKNSDGSIKTANTVEELFGVDGQDSARAFIVGNTVNAEPQALKKLQKDGKLEGSVTYFKNEHGKLFLVSVVKGEISKDGLTLNNEGVLCHNDSPIPIGELRKKHFCTKDEVMSAAWKSVGCEQPSRHIEKRFESLKKCQFDVKGDASVIWRDEKGVVRLSRQKGTKLSQEVLNFDWKTGEWVDNEGRPWRVSENEVYRSVGDKKEKNADLLSVVEGYIKERDTKRREAENTFNGPDDPVSAIATGENAKENVKQFLLSYSQALESVSKESKESIDKPIAHMFFDGTHEWLGTMKVGDNEPTFSKLKVTPTMVWVNDKEYTEVKSNFLSLMEAEKLVETKKNELRQKRLQDLKNNIRYDKNGEKEVDLLATYLKDDEKLAKEVEGAAYLTELGTIGTMVRWGKRAYNWLKSRLTKKGQAALQKLAIHAVKGGQRKSYEIAIDWNGYIVSGPEGVKVFSSLQELMGKTGLGIQTTDALSNEKLDELKGIAKERKQQIESAQKTLEQKAWLVSGLHTEQDVKDEVGTKRSLLGEQVYPAGFYVWKDMSDAYHISRFQGDNIEHFDVDLWKEPGTIRITARAKAEGAEVETPRTLSLKHDEVHAESTLLSFLGVTDGLNAQKIARRTMEMHNCQQALYTRAGKSSWYVPSTEKKSVEKGGGNETVEEAEKKKFEENAGKLKEQAVGAFHMMFQAAGQATIEVVQGYAEGKPQIETYNVKIVAEGDALQYSVTINSVEKKFAYEKLKEMLEEMKATGKNSVNLNDEVKKIEDGIARSLLGDPDYWLKYSKERVLQEVSFHADRVGQKDTWVARAPTAEELQAIPSKEMSLWRSVWEAVRHPFSTLWTTVAMPLYDLYSWVIGNVKAKLPSKLANVALPVCVLTRCTKKGDSWAAEEKELKFDLNSKDKPYVLDVEGKEQHFSSVKEAAESLWKNVPPLSKISRDHQSLENHDNVLKHHAFFTKLPFNIWEPFKFWAKRENAADRRQKLIAGLDKRLQKASVEKKPVSYLYEDCDVRGKEVIPYYILKTVDEKGVMTQKRIECTVDGWKIDEKNKQESELSALLKAGGNSLFDVEKTLKQKKR